MASTLWGNFFHWDKLTDLESDFKLFFDLSEFERNGSEYQKYIKNLNLSVNLVLPFHIQQHFSYSGIYKWRIDTIIFLTRGEFWRAAAWRAQVQQQCWLHLQCLPGVIPQGQPYLFHNVNSLKNNESIITLKSIHIR